ncbi:MAG: transporter substrate-binding domain-containing protein [Synergistales bacterium]|nr:transporter substrate-binding domain-containing protein [Synergistales bacterium]
MKRPASNAAPGRNKEIFNLLRSGMNGLYTGQDRGNAFNGGIMNRARQRGVLRVGTPGDYLPFSFWESPEVLPRGIDVDIIRGFCADQKLECEFVRTSWKALLDDLDADSFDLALGGIAITRQRRLKALFSNSYFRTGKAPLVLREKASRYDSISKIDQSHVRVIVNPGGTNEQFVRKKIRKARIIIHKDNITIFENLVKGVADVMITDAIEARICEKLYPELKAVNPHRPFTSAKLAFLFGIRERSFKKIMDRWILESSYSGFLGQVFYRWISSAMPGNKV